MPRRTFSGKADLGYAEITASAPVSPFINSTSYIAIPGLSITFVTNGQAIIVEAFGTVQSITANVTFPTFALIEDGVTATPVQAVGLNFPATSFLTSPLAIQRRRTPAAGSHTYALYGKVANASNTAWIVASATQIAHIQARNA